MVWQQVVLIAIFMLGTGASLAMIGRPRDPLTPGAFFASLVFTAAMVALVVTI